MEKYWNYLMLLGIALSQAREGEALKCWTCNAIFDEACGDPFEPRENAGVTYVLKECPDLPQEMSPWYTRYEKPVCTKIVTQIGDLTLVIRGCSSRGLNETSKCLLDMDSVLFCQSCEGDGCNSASRLSAVGLLFMPLMLFTVATLLSLKI